MTIKMQKTLAIKINKIEDLSLIIRVLSLIIISFLLLISFSGCNNSAKKLKSTLSTTESTFEKAETIITESTGETQNNVATENTTAFENKETVSPTKATEYSVNQKATQQIKGTNKITSSPTNNITTAPTTKPKSSSKSDSEIPTVVANGDEFDFFD